MLSPQEAANQTITRTIQELRSQIKRTEGEAEAVKAGIVRTETRHANLLAEIASLTALADELQTRVEL